MYAIVEIAGQQFKVAEKQKLFVHRLDNKEGDIVNFDKVLLLDDGKKVDVGVPTVKDLNVSVKVVKHLKGDKVIVFKKKRRKGYRVKNGHRQYLTELLVESIGKKAPSATKKVAAKSTTTTTKKTVAPKKETKAATTDKSTAKKAVAVKKAPVKATGTKKVTTTAKKAAPKKTTPKKTTKK